MSVSANQICMVLEVYHTVQTADGNVVGRRRQNIRVFAYGRSL